MSAVRHTKPETPKQHELKRIRVQEEAMKKEIRVSLSLREQLRELEGDMDETSQQLRAVAENTGNLSSVPMKHFALYKTSYVSATNNKKLVVGAFAYRSQNRDYKLSWEEA